MQDILDRLSRLNKRQEMEGHYTDAAITGAAHRAITELLEVAYEFINEGCLAYRFLPDNEEIGRSGTIRSNFIAAKDRAQATINKYTE